MPDITTFTTEQLLSQISASPLNGSQQAAMNELVNFRIIKKDESDDIVQGGEKITRGGIRPKHAPIVP